MTAPFGRLPAIGTAYGPVSCAYRQSVRPSGAAAECARRTKMEGVAIGSAKIQDGVKQNRPVISGLASVVACPVDDLSGSAASPSEDPSQILDGKSR